jgi:multidrug efflux pump subunit AcrB
VTIPVTIGLFAASFLALPLVPRQFFPSSDRPELLGDPSLPQNASIFATETLSRRFGAALKDDADVERWSNYVGRRAVRFYLPPKCAVAERLLCASSDRRQECGRARAAAAEAGEAACHRMAQAGEPSEEVC